MRKTGLRFQKLWNLSIESVDLLLIGQVSQSPGHERVYRVNRAEVGRGLSGGHSVSQHALQRGCIVSIGLRAAR